MKITKIKREHTALISQGVKNAFGTDSWEFVEKFIRGLSSSSLYKLRVEGSYYVAKVSDPNHPYNNLSREYHAQSIGVKNKVAPIVHYVDPDAGIIIMDYIEMNAPDIVDRQHPDMIKKFARFVKRLHSCDKFQKSDSIYRRVEYVCDQLPHDFQMLNLIKLAVQIKDDIQQQLIDEDDFKSCHSDIHPHNLLYDGNDFCLVDWAAAAQENFYFDLASCVTFFYFYNDDLAKMFLNAYFERSPTQNEKDKFQLMQIFVYVYYGLMFVSTSCMQKINLLPQGEIDKLPSYSQFMGAIGSGEVNLGDGKSQQQLGFIYLKMAESAYKHIG